MSYLRLLDLPAWRACPGRPALEESEGGRPEDVPVLPAPRRAELEARASALQAQGAAVDFIPLASLNVGEITGERGAVGFASVLLADSTESGKTRLEVYPPEPILALAALLKYQILHDFTETNVGTPEELYVEGAKITEAAALSLSLSASITALDHLVPGPYCQGCLAMYRCPALTEDIHKEVFGELQAPDEPDLVALPAAQRALKPADVPAVLKRAMAKVPLLEAWCASVRAAARLKHVKASPPGAARTPKRKRRRKAKARASAPAAPKTDT
jgi:hypothetical protein